MQTRYGKIGDTGKDVGAPGFGIDVVEATGRTIADGELAFFSTWCPAGTSIETLVRIEGHRWAIEDNFETAKNELGLDQCIIGADRLTLAQLHAKSMPAKTFAS